MNKKYITPSVKMLSFNATAILAGSITPNNEIGDISDGSQLSKDNTIDFVGCDDEE